MFKALTHTFIYVLDQDEALDFYVGKLGLEVGTDADLGFMRWLTVSVPGRPGSELVLSMPEMGHDEETAAEIRALIAKGGGSGVIFSVDDCRRTYEELVAKGVEFTQEPTEHFYGIDCGLRDPFGNPLRFTQPAPGPIEIPSAGERAQVQ
jgi:catechol 2,3-dioxygenase-like lactoylglutathione lyase family enzyme